MLNYVWLAIAVIVVRMMYTRHYPIYGIPCIQNIDQIQNRDMIILDIRDYNTNHLISSDLHIPVAYLKRFYKEIPDQPVHIIAENTLDRNVGVRFLQKKGVFVKSYSLTTCDCKKNRKKGALQYGIQ